VEHWISLIPQDLYPHTANDEIWILGGGQFGSHAVSMLYKNSPGASIILVEKKRLAEPPENVTCVHEDGIAWLTRNLTADAKVSKIVPALPLHLAAEWLKKILSEKDIPCQPADIPDELLNHFPNPLRQSSSQAVLSHADFICPSHCREPDKICTHTGQKRPQALYELIKNMEYQPFTSLVVRSRQFAPGVGGFFPEDLWNLYEHAKSILNTPLLIGTACKCHGIIDGLTIGDNL
jgi:hypothetical protein